MKTNLTYHELSRRRIELVKEIRELHDSDLPIEEIDRRMLELDAEMEDVENQLLVLSLG